MKRTLYLTALLAIPTLHARLDGTPPEKKDDKTPENGGAGKREMTAEEWEAQRRTQLAKDTLDTMTNRVIKLEADNHDLRRKAAPEGGRILTADEAKRWAAWEALGKPDEVKGRLDQGTKDREILQKQEKREGLAKVAEAAGWDPEAFADLDAMAGGLEWSVQEIKKGEEKVQQVTVKVGDKQMDAEAFAEERWKKFLPILQSGESQRKEDPSPKPDANFRPPVGGTSRAGGGKGYSVEQAEQAKAASGQYDM